MPPCVQGEPSDHKAHTLLAACCVIAAHTTVACAAAVATAAAAHLEGEAVGGVHIVRDPVGGALHLPGGARLVGVNIKHCRREGKRARERLEVGRANATQDGTCLTPLQQPRPKAGRASSLMPLRADFS